MARALLLVGYTDAFFCTVLELPAINAKTRGTKPQVFA
jgi:hypothetical protein